MVIPGYVLTGGAGLRMGQDKATLCVEGVPMATRVATALRAGGCDPLFTVGKTPPEGLDLPFVSDGTTAHHPLFGVAAALTHATAPLVCIAACDLWRLDAAAVAAILKSRSPCVAEALGRTHPLFAVLPSTWADMARTMALAGRSAHALVADLPRIVVPDAVLANANSPADLVASPPDKV